MILSIDIGIKNFGFVFINLNIGIDLNSERPKPNKLKLAKFKTRSMQRVKKRIIIRDTINLDTLILDKLPNYIYEKKNLLEKYSSKLVCYSQIKLDTIMVIIFYLSKPSNLQIVLLNF